MSPRESYKDPVDSSTDNHVVQDDRPLRVLVQTKTHLVPGDKFTEFRQRFEAMRRMICHHVWGRDFDRFRERFWSKGEFDLNDRDCWFFVDHCDPSSELDPNLPLLRYRWTGTEFVAILAPLPGEVRRQFQRYPFRRSKLRYQKYVPGPRPPSHYRSHAEEMRFQREMLRTTLVSGLGLTHELVRFVEDHPEEAAWVKARVSPEAWARLNDSSEYPGEVVGHYIWVEDPPEGNDAMSGNGANCLGC
ncbi:hypothetical protein VTI28DRAFT_10258 [Corynascus sepedonium]